MRRPLGLIPALREEAFGREKSPDRVTGALDEGHDAAGY
jgi:hypothetical protein